MPAEATRILVVEDEPSLAETMRYNLEREGFSVSLAEDGRRALERFRAEPPALVLMRDYFVVSLVGATLFSSMLYWVMGWFVTGALKS